jgi:hypothetical protein
MLATPVQPAGSFEELTIDDLLVIDVNDRYLYVKEVGGLDGLGAAERRTLEALAKHGDTVFLAVGEPGPTQLSYRLPDTENAVALGPDGLQGVIQQWFAWASNAER